MLFYLQIKQIFKPIVVLTCMLVCQIVILFYWIGIGLCTKISYTLFIYLFEFLKYYLYYPNFLKNILFHDLLNSLLFSYSIPIFLLFSHKFYFLTFICEFCISYLLSNFLPIFSRYNILKLLMHRKSFSII